MALDRATDKTLAEADCKALRGLCKVIWLHVQRTALLNVLQLEVLLQYLAAFQRYTAGLGGHNK